MKDEFFHLKNATKNMSKSEKVQVPLAASYRYASRNCSKHGGDLPVIVTNDVSFHLNNLV